MAISQRRVGWLRGIFALLLLVAGVRAFQLATLNAGRLSRLAALEHVQTVTTPAARGSILDRNGAVLAVSEAADDVSVTPGQIKDPAAVAAALAPLLHLSSAHIEQAITHPGSPLYALLKAQVPVSTVRRVRALNLTGVGFSSDPLRVYPDKYLAAQLLGGVGSDGTGLAGLEYEFNSQLTGTAGVNRVVYDNRGQPISVAGPTPVDGKTITLTLDAALNQYTDSVVAATGEKYGALRATAIVLDLKDNSILAMSNWPRVDANDPAKVGASSNWAVGLDYEPGSTFKVVAIGGALSDGLITPDTVFRVPDYIQVYDRQIHDSEYHGTEELTTRQILAQSSNVGAVEIGEKLQDARMYYWIRRYGFGTPPNVDIPGADRGLVPPLAAWSGSSIGNIPIGQGIEVTPLQLATAYAAIARGGLLQTPHVVQSIGGHVLAVPRAHRILTTEVADELRHMLLGVFREGGTAHEIQIPGYELAGKTGTASKVVNGVYSKTNYIASFVGFAPEQHPRLEAIVLVDRPRGAYFGTEVAAPAWKQIMNFALPYLRIAPH